MEKSWALGLVEPGWHETGTELEFEILGEWFKFTVIEESSYDPQNEKLLR
jgi:dimethylglycine dehydrogenase